MIKNHIKSLQLMLDHCTQFQIYLNLNKCIFCAHFGFYWVMLFERKQCAWILQKIAIIVDLPPPTSLKQLQTIIGHTCYYHKFIRGYAEITTSMEKLLKKYVKFQ